ncbi:MAG: hypothetical protein IBJ03_01765 [Gemmatimonadaceae bacterium]|nr:hypothetical protein [Gemmatimonadaceae bacterium]
MYRFVTFGGCAVVSDEGEVKGAATQQRRLAMLAVLARAGDRGVSRTRLLQLFWPDEDDEERRRKALAQALYALRRDLGDEAVIVGTQELRLDGGLLPHDVGLFAEHLKHGRHADAVALYAGPFLGGFHLAGASAFERWAEEERRVLERDFLRAVEMLAADAERNGQFGDAVQWRRKAAAVDPLDSRATLALMRALANNGEVAAAIRQAAIHETLIQEELELPPDREVVAYAEELRDNPPVAAPAQPVAIVAPLAVAQPAADVVEESIVEVPVETPAVAVSAGVVPAPATESAPAPVPARWMQWLLAATLLIVADWALWPPQEHEPGPGEPRYHRPPSIAVGLISDFRTPSQGPVRSLAALLATSLARSEALRVVSAARLSELLHQGAMGDSTEAAYIAAARRAGAHELIDGALFDPGDGELRLDLRRVDVETGSVLAALTIRASDLFALADSGTTRLLDGFGIEPLRGSVRDVTTRSATAHRFYAEGLRANASYDLEAARRLFGEALKQDSLFAMAAYEYARVNPNRAELADEMERALRLARRATMRERLVIQAGWASTMQLAGLRETADSLLTLDNQDPQALLFAAEARLNLGQPAEARPYLERAIALDSIALRTRRPEHCYGCEAVQLLGRAWMDEDAPDSAVASIKRWVDAQPQSAEAWGTYARVLDFTGRLEESHRAIERTLALDPAYPSGFVRHISNLVRGARLEEAERLAREQTTLATADQRLDGWWQLASILRHQGRMQEALAAVNRFRALRDTVDGGRMALNHAYLPAHILHDAGRTRAAIALFDSMAAGTVRPGENAANVQRLRTSSLTAAADFTALLGDTIALPARLKAIEVAGAQSGVVRDTRAHHYVRGLMYRARGNNSQALTEWRAAVAPPIRGYHSRVNLELARALLQRGEADEAIRMIRPLLRDVVDGIAVTHTEMHELLAQAHMAAGRRDSAIVHAEYVARAWARGEPTFRQRAANLSRRVVAQIN